MNWQEGILWLRSDPLGWALLIFCGAALGSFVNVVIHRLPRGESVVRPPSHCPGCQQRIAWYDNVPLLSFLWLRGRCRRCGQSISLRYPLVEALAAGLTLAVGLWAPSAIGAAATLLFALALLAIIFIDYDHRIIPDSITLPGILIGLLVALFTPRSLAAALGGVLVGGGGLLAVAWAYRRVTGRDGLGMGDVKLMAMVGAFIGWQGALATLVLGSLGGSLVGVALIASRRGSGQTALPFGSFLAPAAWVALFVGERLWQAYLGLFGL